MDHSDKSYYEFFGIFERPLISHICKSLKFATVNAFVNKNRKVGRADVHANDVYTYDVRTEIRRTVQYRQTDTLYGLMWHFPRVKLNFTD